MKTIMKDTLIAILVLGVVFLASLGLHAFFQSHTLIPALFVLGVLVTARLTNGYLYGVCFALISVLAVNFAFTFPYFTFDFTVQENIVSTIIMISVTILTGTLTTKIKAQERMKKEASVEKMRADLLRAVSHDLRTPLTTIYGSSSTMIEHYQTLTEEQKLDILHGIQTDADWLIHMVENLLSITKLDSKQVTLVKNPVVLEELLDSVLTKFRKRYPEQDVRLKFPDEFVMVAADVLLIEQVFLNLLENAVLHAKGMTELKLNVFAGDDKVVFEVIDDGCGIAKEKLKHIFSGYYLSDTSASEPQKHCVGIGLSVCAAIIKAHGSEIRAVNMRSGGMVFRFALERVEDLDE